MIPFDKLKTKRHINNDIKANRSGILNMILYLWELPHKKFVKKKKKENKEDGNYGLSTTFKVEIFQEVLLCKLKCLAIWYFFVSICFTTKN